MENTDHDMPSDAPHLLRGRGNPWRGHCRTIPCTWAPWMPRLVALNRRTGEVVWNVEIEKYHRGFSGDGRAAGGQGSGGGRQSPAVTTACGGFLDAYDAKDRRAALATLYDSG